MAIATAGSARPLLPLPSVRFACVTNACCCDASGRSRYGEGGFSGRHWSGPLRNWRTFKLRNPGHAVPSKKRVSKFGIKAAAGDSLYDTLGVSPSATEREIKQAYRKLALRYHPDVNKEAGAQAKFLEIKQAYQTLVDVTSRAKYDRSRQGSPSWEPFSWNTETSRSRSQARTAPQEDFYGLSEFFKDLQTSFGRAINMDSADAALSLEMSDRQKRAQPSSKSLWEELADIGEEFVEFLEKELDVKDGSGNYKEPRKPTNFYDFDQADDSKASPKGAEPGKASVENEIEDMLAKLKEELGL